MWRCGCLPPRAFDFVFRSFIRTSAQHIPKIQIVAYFGFTGSGCLNRLAGQLTEIFPDREGPDDPNLLTNMDDATMNSLLKNLIAKLSNKCPKLNHDINEARPRVQHPRLLPEEDGERRRQPLVAGRHVGLGHATILA